jgi:hypothetical protein
MAGQLYGGGAEGASGGEDGKEREGTEPEDGDARGGVEEGASTRDSSEEREGTELTGVGAGTTSKDPVMRILAARAGQVDRGDETWRSRVQRVLRAASTGAVATGRGPALAQESRPGGGMARTCKVLVRGLMDSR